MRNTVKQASNFQTFLETLLVDSVRLKVEEVFPHSLLLHENDDNENVSDMSINQHKLFTRFDRVRHVIDFSIAEMQNVFLGPNNPDKEKIKRYRRYLRKREADVSIQIFTLSTSTNFVLECFITIATHGVKIGFSIIRKKCLPWCFAITVI